MLDGESRRVPACAETPALMSVRLNRILPYAIVLAIVSYLYFLAGKIDFVAPGGRIGPNFWPRVILALTALTCFYEIVNNLLFARREGTGDLEGVLGVVLHGAAVGLEGHRALGLVGEQPVGVVHAPLLEGLRVGAERVARALLHDVGARGERGECR